MPKRNDIKSILIIGAGPIIIGQAEETLVQLLLICQEPIP